MKQKLPRNNKRWIDWLPDDVYKKLKKTDKDNYLHFQKVSKEKYYKEQRLDKLKKEIEILKKQISELNLKEEYSYLKIQFLHNVFGCRLDVVRGKRIPNSLRNNPTKKIAYKRKTKNGKPLKVYYVWNGKIESNSLEKPKPVYFQTEEKLKETLSEITGKKKSDFLVIEIKKFLKKEYTTFIYEKMLKLGIVKFSNTQLLFKDFVKWYKVRNPLILNSSNGQKPKKFKDHILQITKTKDVNYYNNLTIEERKSFSTWLILKYLSFCYELIPILSTHSSLHSLKPDNLYKVLIEIIPKGDYKFDVIKRKKDRNHYSNKMIEYISTHYECSKEISKEYIDVLYEIGEYEKMEKMLFSKYGGIKL